MSFLLDTLSVALLTCLMRVVSTPVRRSAGMFRCSRWNSRSASPGNAESSSSVMWLGCGVVACKLGWWFAS